MARLSSGADIIDLRLPFSADEFLSQTERLIQQSANANCIMRLAVSRGAVSAATASRVMNNPTL